MIVAQIHTLRLGNTNIVKLFLVGICCFLLAGCGGDQAEKNIATEEAIDAVSEKRANNPLAKQQSFMKEAAMVQGILDKDADAKKELIEEGMDKD